MDLVLAMKPGTSKTTKSPGWYYVIVGATFLSLLPLLFDHNIWRADISLQGENWNRYLEEGLGILSFLILPMYIIVSSTLLPEIKFRDESWKQSIRSPQRLPDIFNQNYRRMHFLIVLFILLYNIVLMASLQQAAEHVFNWGDIILLNLRAYIIILAIISIQCWLGIRLRSLLMPVVIGFFIWLAGVMVFIDFNWIDTNETGFASSVLSFFPKQEIFLQFIRCSSTAYAVLFFVIGYQYFRRKRRNGNLEIG